MTKTGFLTAAALAVGTIAAAPAFAQTPNRALAEIPADKAKVTGSIVVDYNSRSVRSQTNQDVYEFGELAVADLMVMRGTITRVPDTSLTYSIKFDVVNPQNPTQIARDVAILRGEMPIASGGRYTPETGNLRIDVVKGNQTSSKFTGTIQGRDVVKWWDVAKRLQAAKKEATKIYSRLVDGKVISIKIKNPDPLGFDRTGLAAGPFSFLVESRVTGSLDYDYELGNWLTDQNGVTFSYTIGDKSYVDKVTGSIRFVEEPGEFADAKGKKIKYTSYYDYNLRVNEPAAKRDDSFFTDTTQADSDAFFASNDQTKPGIYGRVYYSDSDTACKQQKDDKGALKCVGPTRSEITYDLKASGLTYQQLTNWVKLEQLVIGPFTDE
jgi:hypothetical protein